MKIKKNYWLLICFIILSTLFNLICFWTVNDYTTCFYISIVFGNLSILMYTMAFCVMKNKKYIYLNMQNPFIANTYYFISTILNFIFILCQLQNVKFNIVINIIILAAFLIIFFSVFAANSHSIQLTEIQKDQINNFYNIKDISQSLLNKGKNFIMNKKLENLYDNISSSQIIENDNIKHLNDQIFNNLEFIRLKLISNENEDEIYKLINNTNDIIEQRNIILSNWIKRS